MEYVKKIDLLSVAVEVEYLGRPRLMVSVAKIGQLPSLDIPQWIPCSERLPKEGEHYLITVKEANEVYVTSDDYFSYGWDDFGEDVIAWMPLPKPWEGADDE